MSDAQHTPGPWVVVDAHPQRSAIDVRPQSKNAKWDYSIASLFNAPGEQSEEVDEIYVNDPIRMANARLIAAAPELLAACEEALEEITVLVPGRVADPIIRKLEAVIIKAKAGAA